MKLKRESKNFHPLGLSLATQGPIWPNPILFVGNVGIRSGRAWRWWEGRGPTNVKKWKVLGSFVEHYPTLPVGLSALWVWVWVWE